MPGVAKCGTTTLHDILTAHPRITGGIEKEARFVMDDHDPLARDHAIGPAGMAAWQNCFADKGAGDFDYWLDASPQYQYQDIAPQVISGLDPAPRLIFTVRSPATRIASLYRYAVYHHKAVSGFEGLADFVDALKQGDDPRIGPRRMLANAWADTHYDAMLERWREVVEPANIYCIWLESLNADRAGVLTRLAAWLGVSPEPLIAADTSRSNPSVQTRSRTIKRVGARLAKVLPDNAVVRAAKTAVRQLNSAELPAGEIEQHKGLIRQLDIEFAPSVDRFNAMVRTYQPDFREQSFA